jgi:hypothetical protein
MPALAQELAHPGWRGNSIAPEPWYRHTTLVRFPAGTTFAQAIAGMDAMSTVGADSMILPDLTPPAGAPHPFAGTFGTEDQLDTLLREASARRMHVLLQAPLARLAANPGEARFWMNHGLAGFDVGTVTPADLGSLQTLRTTLDHLPGQRILLARGTGLDSSRGAPLAFRIVSGDMASGAGQQFIEVAAPPSAPKPPVAQPASQTGTDADPALLQSFLPLLLAPGQPIFDSRIIGSVEGRNALHQILQLRNGHPALRNGHATVLQTGDIHAWLVKGTAGQRSIVLVQNTGSAPAGLHLEQPLKTAGARGTFLRVFFRTDNGMGPLHLEGNLMPPGTFAIAELQ